MSKNCVPTRIRWKGESNMIWQIKDIFDRTFGRVGKWLLWKTGKVDLIWYYGKLRIIRTNAETGERFIAPQYPGADWTDIVEVDRFLDKSGDIENKNTYNKKHHYMYNDNFIGYGHFTGFFSKPTIKNHLFKSDKVKMLQTAAAWDRDEMEKNIETYNDVDLNAAKYAAQSTHSHSINTSTTGVAGGIVGGNNVI